MTQDTGTKHTTLICLADVLQRTGMRRTMTYDLIKEGSFPKPVKVGAASRWVEQEVQEWIEALMSARTSQALRKPNERAAPIAAATAA